MNKLKIKKKDYNFTFVKNVVFDFNAINKLNNILKLISNKKNKKIVILFIDSFFKKNKLKLKIDKSFTKKIIYIDTKKEPSNDLLDSLIDKYKSKFKSSTFAIAGIGGGSTLDVAKGFSILLNNFGKTQKYQGWNLVTNEGVIKIGIPTISGTGSESSRTCVFIDKKRKIKLGMNSNYSVFDYLILDPNLSKTVPLDQFFYTAMDTYIHCIESINGKFREPIADAYNQISLEICNDVFLSNNLKSKINRKKLMNASYIGGMAIGNTYVGLIHPLSAALSTVYGIHHCVANCIVMRSMRSYYYKEYSFFWKIVKKHNIYIPKLSEYTKGCDLNFKDLFSSFIIHEKPLINALGNNAIKILTQSKVEKLFRGML